MEENEYIVISKSDIQKRIEECDRKLSILHRVADNESVESLYITNIAITKISSEKDTLNTYLSKSTPLITIVEEAFNAGKEYGFYESHNANSGDIPDNETYISNLKLDV